jgi:hypothetical protein
MADEKRRVTPKYPMPAELDWQQAGYDYDADSDTVYLHLFGLGQPSVVVHTPSEIDLLVDPATSSVIGFQIEGFLTQVVPRDPQYLLLARNAGIDPQVLDRIEREIDPETRKRADFQVLSGQQLLAMA